jgi:site-specific DNA recombinase
VFIEFYSRNLATEIVKGSTQKAKKGGTPYRAPLGYINTRETVDDREIRVVALDPKRAHLIRLAFTLYATAQYSLSELAAILEERGLRSRKTRKCPERPLGTNRLSALLRNDYYIGAVHYDGKTYKGRHEPLVTLETFTRVQDILASQRQSGERCWRNHSYLRGTLYCHECKSRLFFVRVRGNGGEYDYFVCKGRYNHTCKQGWHSVAKVEAAVERHYARVQLSDRRRKRIGKQMRDHLDELAGTANIEIARTQRTLSRLDTEESKLLDRYYNDRVSESLYDREQQRIVRERIATEATIANQTIDRDGLLEALDAALALTKDIQGAYHQAAPDQRRLFNQAFFKRLEVEGYDDDIKIVSDELSDPYAKLLANDLIEDAHEEPATNEPEPTTAPASPRGRNAKTDGLSKVAGYHVAPMVELAGLEPATFWLPARRSPN